jgi:hypothetical protein
LLGAIENISAVSKQTLSASGNISEILYNQSVSVETLEKESAILSKNSLELVEAVHKFCL